MEEKTKKFLKSLAGWIIYIGILVGLIYGIPKGLAYVLKTDYPMASITSGSMWPTLKEGDLVFIKGINSKEEIKEGDIVVYQNPKGFTIHRVIQLNENTLITKGDANNVNDSPVEYKDVIGKIVNLGSKPLRIPMLGRVSILMQGHKNAS
jgi:signal peptidase